MEIANSVATILLLMIKIFYIIIISNVIVVISIIITIIRLVIIIIIYHSYLHLLYIHYRHNRYHRYHFYHSNYSLHLRYYWYKPVLNNHYLLCRLTILDCQQVKDFNENLSEVFLSPKGHLTGFWWSWVDK